MKQNRSRRNIANMLVNHFLNHRQVRVISINISLAGNFEIKCHSFTNADCDVKLRVNMSTLTYAFEFYGAHRHSNVRNTSSKRKLLDTSADVDKCYLYHCLINELKEAQLYRDLAAAVKSYKDRGMDHITGRWLTPNEMDDIVANVRVPIPIRELDELADSVEQLLDSVGTDPRKIQRQLYDAGVVYDKAASIPKADLDKFLADTDHLSAGYNYVAPDWRKEKQSSATHGDILDATIIAYDVALHKDK